MSTKTKFSLRDLIRRVSETAPVINPALIAKEVSRLIADNDVREALEQALPEFVQNTITRDRSRTTPTIKFHNDNYRDTPDPGLIPAQRTPGTANKPAPPVGRSWKRDGIRKYANQLSKPFAISFNQDDDWKTLGDFTDQDCRAAASMRDRLAEGNRREAEKMRAFARLLKRHHAETIKDLPDTVLAEVFEADR